MIQSEISACINTLNSKALRTGVLDSTDDYISEMISIEKQERKAGWQSRVKSLEELK